MKITIDNSNDWCYCFNGLNYTQEQYDCIFKYLNFDKLYKRVYIFFKNEKVEKLFFKTFINSDYLRDIYFKSPEGYKWLKNNWGKGVFELWVLYSDKQELKTIVNKVINIRLIKGE